ncbi:MAG: pilus assembly protein [Clostridiales bacterium]|nr:pilus assembly protein [Clostridiales bacterium]
MNSKRGSAIAEAAVVFPIVIIAVLTVVYILIVLYTDAAESARDHLALRNESDTRTETVDRRNNFINVTPEDRFGRMPFQETVDIFDGARLLDRLLFTDRSRVYVIDEVAYIRRIDLMKRVGGER